VDESHNQLDYLREVSAALVCPETKVALELCRIEEAEERARTPLVARADALNTKGKLRKPVGRTPWVLIREDRASAYPVVDGIPILLVPEALKAADRQRAADLTQARYAEAYEEMDFYNAVADEEARRIAGSESDAVIAPAIGISQAEKDAFPHPRGRWIDAVYDCAAEWDAYQHLSPIRSKRVVQLGGKGGHAAKFLLAGASEGWTVTPMLGEALCARALADRAGIGDRLRCVVAIAEELPFRSETVDAIYSGGCLHHMQTAMALPEAARVLREGGKFAAVDPWRAPLYALGTKVLGKREPGVYCRPLTKARVEPLWGAFGKARVVQHGTLTRYPLLALSKFGVSCSLSVAWYCMQADDAVCSLLPGLRRMGSSVAVLGSK
jgi:uncharacterized protein YbaR (Trm112 family)/SAM-dependent methyltransferase